MAVAAVLVGISGATQASEARPAQTVTMTLARIYDPGNRIYRLRFSGTISSRAAGEYVTVERRECGRSYFTSFAGTQTENGGFWQAEQYAPRPEFDTNTY
ncbi:MAG TPA: hypothetical protein VK926_06990, partial [Gaiellaceae bacterium]|nr:hypothetical protein [Gaiellaceae bacterium]